MILDNLVEFADGEALSTAGTGLALVGDVINLQAARDIGNGKTLYLVIQVDVQVDSAADGASVEFQLVSDAQAAIAADGSETVHWKSAAIPEATLAPGYTVAVIPLPYGYPEYEQYIGIQQNVSGEAVTAGAISAFLVLDPSAWKAYPEGEN